MGLFAAQRVQAAMLAHWHAALWMEFADRTDLHPVLDLIARAVNAKRAGLTLCADGPYRAEFAAFARSQRLVSALMSLGASVVVERAQITVRFRP